MSPFTTLSSLGGMGTQSCLCFLSRLLSCQTVWALMQCSSRPNVCVVFKSLWNINADQARQSLIRGQREGSSSLFFFSSFDKGWTGYCHHCFLTKSQCQDSPRNINDGHKKICYIFDLMSLLIGSVVVAMNWFFDSVLSKINLLRPCDHVCGHYMLGFLHLIFYST